MRVLVASPYHPELTPGGAQQVAYDLFDELRRTPNMEPVFLASAIDTPKANVLRRPGASITGFESREDEFLWWNDGMDHWTHSHLDPSPLRDFVDWLGYLKPDVVSLHHFFRLGSELPALLRNRTHAKSVLTLHEYMAVCIADGHMKRLTTGTVCPKPSDFKCHECVPAALPLTIHVRNRQIWDALSHADALVVPSNSARKVLERAGFPFPTETILNGSTVRSYPLGDGHSHSSEGLPHAKTREIVFGFFGQLLDDKGLLTLNAALAELRAMAPRGWRVEIHGGNEQFASAELQEQIRVWRRGVDPRVKVRGAFTQDQAVSRMAMCDWIVIPSTWEETYSMVLSEARLARRPVIASNLGALSERVVNNVDGMLVEPNSPKHLAQAMMRALDVNLLASMSGAVTKVQAIPEMTSEYVKLFSRLLVTDEAKRRGTPSPHGAHGGGDGVFGAENRVAGGTSCE